MTALTFVVGWIVVSALCMVFFAVGATLGYRRGWDDCDAQLRRLDAAADTEADLQSPLRARVGGSRR